MAELKLLKQAKKPRSSEQKFLSISIPLQLYFWTMTVLCCRCSRQKFVPGDQVHFNFPKSSCKKQMLCWWTCTILWAILYRWILGNIFQKCHGTSGLSSHTSDTEIQRRVNSSISCNDNFSRKLMHINPSFHSLKSVYSASCSWSGVLDVTLKCWITSQGAEIENFFLIRLLWKCW